jgi:hypothetical protein
VPAGGTFTLHPASLAPSAPSLFVAGGIGVTPLVSLLSELVERWAAADADLPDQPGRTPRRAPGAPPQAVLLYSARAPQEFALLPRLLDLAAASGGRLQLRLHCSEYAPPPPSPRAEGAAAEAAGPVGAVGGGGDGGEAPSGSPQPLLLRGGVRSLLRRRLLPEDLDAAVSDLLGDGRQLHSGGRAGSSSDEEDGGGGGGAGRAPRVTAYVCGPPALSDAAVAQLEADGARVGAVVMERWW